MQQIKKASSIIEAMVIMLIVSLGTVGVYKVYTNSMKLSQSVELKIQAISIAKEALEAVTNIRDTNWLLYSNNTSNCWNTLNYDSLCLTGAGAKIGHSGSYILTADLENRWLLTPPSSSFALAEYSDPDYRNFFQIKRDIKGFYTHSGATQKSDVFTREIKTKYIDTNGDSNTDESDEKLEISVHVYWRDVANNRARSLVLKTILSNWKK